MERLEGCIQRLEISLPPDQPMPSLAELAQTSCNDWSALPHSLLGEVFRRLLEQHVTLEEILRAWQGLALVCKGWLMALQEATPLCLELTKPAHLSSPARRWLSSVPMEVVMLSRTMLPPPGADCQLLAREEFQAHSSSVLRSLMHVGLDTLPLLHNFSRLKQVALFCRDDADPARPIDAAIFQQLPKLNCLTIAGYWGMLDTSELPTRLKHLALSNYNEGHSLDIVLPEGMKQLELLSARADSVFLDWVDVCARCEEVQVAASLAVLRVGREPVACLVREVGYSSLQDHLYKRVSSAMAEGEHFQEAMLAFFDLALYSGPAGEAQQRGPIVPIEPDDFLQTLRDELLPLGVDVNPALEIHPEFVRDVPSPDACFVLELVRQEAGKPKSMHFTTPVTDSEIRLLTSQPVWRISWCDDERAAQVLADPHLLTHSAGTLTDLLSIPLVPELDLRPFTKLVSVLGTVKTDDVAAVLRRMPRQLESLCLTAEDSQHPRDFDAELVQHLRHLKELSLYSHRRHNLATLSRRVNMIRILNPLVAEGEVIGRGANYLWPDLSGSASSSSSSSSSSEDGSGSNGGSESGDSFSSAASEVDADSDSDRGAAVGVPEEPEQAAEPVASAPPEGGKPAAAPNAPETITAPAPAGPAAVGEMDDDGSSTVSSDYLEAEHGHGHKHGAAGADEEPHSKQACADPYCPIHSGKSFLQISLTDNREHSSIDLSALLAAGFQMLTITLSAEQPNARCTLLHEGSWRSILAALETSDIEVMELNCQAASMVFRSTSLLHRLTEVSVESAIRYVAENYGEVWQVKSWNGNTAADGVLEGSRGYALMRRSVVEAAAQLAAEL